MEFSHFVTLYLDDCLLLNCKHSLAQRCRPNSYPGVWQHLVKYLLNVFIHEINDFAKLFTLEQIKDSYRSKETGW